LTGKTTEAPTALRKKLADAVIPKEAALYPQFKGQEIKVELNGDVETDVPGDQLAFALAETPPPYKRRKAKRKGSAELGT